MYFNTITFYRKGLRNYHRLQNHKGRANKIYGENYKKKNELICSGEIQREITITKAKTKWKDIRE